MFDKGHLCNHRSAAPGLEQWSKPCPACIVVSQCFGALCALCMSRCSGRALWSLLTQQGRAQVLRITLCLEHTATAGQWLMNNDVNGYVPN